MVRRLYLVGHLIVSNNCVLVEENCIWSTYLIVSNNYVLVEENYR